MLFSRTPMFVVIIVCLGTIYTLFNIKNNVMAIRTELAEVKKQMGSGEEVEPEDSDSEPEDSLETEAEVVQSFLRNEGL